MPNIEKPRTATTWVFVDLPFTRGDWEFTCNLLCRETGEQIPYPISRISEPQEYMIDLEATWLWIFLGTDLIPGTYTLFVQAEFDEFVNMAEAVPIVVRKDKSYGL